MLTLATTARAARRAAILDAASREFNSVGVAAASLNSIARSVGASRASLYNYFSDREDLLLKCYLRACELMQADLRRAALGSGDGLDKVTTFLRLSLEVDHPPAAVLSELAFLSPERQQSVREARAANVSALTALVTQGRDEGVIRACDVDLLVQAIMGVLAWAPISKAWTDNFDETFAIRTAAAIPSLVADGVLADGVAIPDLTIRISDVLSTEAGSERDQRLEAIARAGSRLFNRRGIDGVSLDDVAAELNMTKGAVYHYFENKPAFVAYCYDRAFNLYDRLMEAAEKGATGLESTMIIKELNVQAQIEDFHPLSLTTGLNIFSSEDKTRFTARTSDLARRSVAFGRSGVKAGLFRPYDLEPVALLAAGMFSYLAKWLPPGDNRSSEYISREISRFSLLGLRNRPGA